MEPLSSWWSIWQTGWKSSHNCFGHWRGGIPAGWGRVSGIQCLEESCLVWGGDSSLDWQQSGGDGRMCVIQVCYESHSIWKMMGEKRLWRACCCWSLHLSQQYNKVHHWAKHQTLFQKTLEMIIVTQVIWQIVTQHLILVQFSHTVCEE